MNAEVEKFKIFVRNFVNVKEKLQSEFVDVTFNHKGVECNVKNKYLKVGSEDDSGGFVLQRVSSNVVDVYNNVCGGRVYVCKTLVSDVSVLIGNFVELDGKVYYIKSFDDNDNITISEQNTHDFPDRIIKTDAFFEKCKPFCKNEISYCESVRIEEGFYTIEKKIKVPKSNEPLIVINDIDYNIFLNQRENILTVKTKSEPSAVLHTSVFARMGQRLFLFYKEGVRVFSISQGKQGVVVKEDGYSPYIHVRFDDGTTYRTFKTQADNDLVLYNRL